jgi:hypothetical protein
MSCRGGCWRVFLALRRRLAWEGAPIRDYFHASEDKQVVRDAVFEELKKHQFSVQATIIEKSKAYPRVRETTIAFINMAGFTISNMWPRRLQKAERNY